MSSIGFIVGSPSSPSSSRDIPIKSFLEGLGHTVTYVDDSDTPAAGSYDMLAISESCSTSNAEGWHEVDSPILVFEPALGDDGYGSSASSSGAGDETAKVNLAHYITNDYSVNDEFEYVDPGKERGYVTGWANDVKALLVVANNTTRALILSIEDGDTDANGDTAINRRVMFTHPRAGEWTNDIKEVVERAVDWLLGNDSGGTGTGVSATNSNTVANAAGVASGNVAVSSVSASVSFTANNAAGAASGNVSHNAESSQNVFSALDTSGVASGNVAVDAESANHSISANKATAYSAFSGQAEAASNINRILDATGTASGNVSQPAASATRTYNAQDAETVISGNVEKPASAATNNITANAATASGAGNASENANSAINNFTANNAAGVASGNVAVDVGYATRSFVAGDAEGAASGNALILSQAALLQFTGLDARFESTAPVLKTFDICVSPAASYLYISANQKKLISIYSESDDFIKSQVNIE